MFTKNWHKLLAGVMLRKSPGTYLAADGTEKEMATSVTLIQLGDSSSATSVPSMYHLRKGLSSEGGVVIGTGTTPPSANDICLSGEEITTFTCSASVSVVMDEDENTITAMYTITNTGSEAFTIGEIALCANCSSKNNGYSQKTYKALLERTVLESPITIEPGGVGQVTYTIRMNYPTA